MKKLTLMISFFSLMVSCGGNEEPQYYKGKLSIRNDSQRVFQFFVNSYIGKTYVHLADGELPEEKPSFSLDEYTSELLLGPGDEYSVFFSADYDYIGSGYHITLCKGDKINVYAFSPDTLDAYDWKVIVAEKKYWYNAYTLGDEYVNIYFPEGFTYCGE